MKVTEIGKEIVRKIMPIIEMLGYEEMSCGAIAFDAIKGTNILTLVDGVPAFVDYQECEIRKVRSFSELVSWLSILLDEASKRLGEEARNAEKIYRLLKVLES